MTALTLIKRRLYGHKEEGRHIFNLDLRDARAFGSKWEACRFEQCQMQASDFIQAEFTKCVFKRCDLTLVNFSMARFSGCTFSECALNQAKFTGIVAHDISFENCSMNYASLEEATLRGSVDFVHCNLHGADLTFGESQSHVIASCNLWGAKIAFGCQFWNGSIVDDRTVMMGAALLERVSSGELAKALGNVAGDAVDVVERLMRRRDVNNEST